MFQGNVHVVQFEKQSAWFTAFLVTEGVVSLIKLTFTFHPKDTYGVCSVKVFLRIPVPGSKLSSSINYCNNKSNPRIKAFLWVEGWEALIDRWTCLVRPIFKSEYLRVFSHFSTFSWHYCIFSIRNGFISVLVYAAFPYDTGRVCELKNQIHVNKHFRLALHSHKTKFAERSWEKINWRHHSGFD